MVAQPSLYAEALILLSGAVIAAPIFKRIGLGTVLGYLAAGIVMGPLTQLLRDPEEVLHASEIGVVMLLFVIGLELKPSRLWAMRYDIFGLGAMQVIVTGLALTLLSMLFLDSVGERFVAGFGLALSSTAFAMQMLEEAGDTDRPHGRKAFAILLFQDLAIVPLLAVLPLLSPRDGAGMDWAQFGAGLAAIAVLVLAGRYLINPLFSFIARAGAREAMIAAALLIVIGSAALMAAAGLSMALGAFLAGVLLAESSYRHELEANIEPFRGIFLAVFFMAIGMSLDPAALLRNWQIVLIAVPASMLVKSVAIYGSARLFGNSHPVATRAAAVLSQHGEFAFVLISAALALRLVSPDFASLMIAVVILSMALTPLTVWLGERLVEQAREEEPDEDFEGAGATVLMIGFSRLGQIASQTLLASGVDVTIIDTDPSRIRNAASFGFRIYFGDGARADVLRAAGIGQSALVAVCTAKPEVTTRIVELIQRNWPDKKLYVRAYDRGHALELVGMSVDYQIRETFESALVMGGKMLEGLGRSSEEVRDVVEATRRRDSERMAVQVTEGIQAGRHMLFTRPVQPEPLVAPRGEGSGLDERSRKLLAGGEDRESAAAAEKEQTP